MATRASEVVESHHIERLRLEIAEAIAATVAYPPFYDFRTGKLQTRPIDRPKVAEIEQFIGSANFAPIERASPSSPDTRRFIERLILRYLEVNPSLAAPRAARYLPMIRVQSLRLAADTHRRFVAFLTGNERDFGTRRQAASWASPRRGGRAPTPDMAHSGRLLEAALQQPKPAAHPASAPKPWQSAPADATAPAPAMGGLYSQPGAMPFDAPPPVPYPPYTPDPAHLADQPTGPLAALAPSPRGPAGGPIPMRELPPDLLNLYGDYLSDLKPARGNASPPTPVSAPREAAPRMPAAPPPQPIARPAPAAPQPGSPRADAPPADARGDQLIFWQLRYQLEAYVRLAARSYGLPGHGGDPSSVLDELRSSGFVDEADLRIAEGVFALTDRVTAQGQATTADYRQALMLYLLYHRSHLSV